MASKTQVIPNYHFQLPPGLQLSPQGAGQLGITLPENKPAPPASLQGRVQSLSALLAHADLNSLESFAQVPLRTVPASLEFPFLTSGATSTEDNIANISYFIRTLMPEAASTQAIGVTTGENVFQGFWAAYKAAKRFNKSEHIGDTQGMIEGGMDAARGVSQSLGGAAYLGYRGTMIAADIHNVNTTINATTTLGKAAYGLGMVGNVLFTLFYIFIAAWSAHGLWQDVNFSNAMKANERGDADMFKFLMGKVIASPKKKLEKLNAHWNTLTQAKKEMQIKSFKEGLQKSALEGLTKHFIRFQEQMLKAGQLNGKKPLSKAEVKELLTELFSAKDAAMRKGPAYTNYLKSLELEKEDVGHLDFSMLELIGFSLEEAKRQSKKEAKFSRATDDASVEAVKKAASRGLGPRLESGDALVQGTARKELAELKGKVTSENTKAKIIHTALLIVGVLGIVASILGFFVLPPAGMIALTVITLLLCGGMMATDGYSMFTGLNNGPPGKHDKKYLLIIGGVFIAAMAVSIAVTLAFGLPIMPLILAGVICGLGLMLLGFSYYKLIQKEKKWIEHHPEFETFARFLDSQQGVQDAELDEKVVSLFKKLSKSDRRAVRDKFFEMSKQGEFRFKTERNKWLDATCDFGSTYLFTQITPEAMNNEKEHQLLLRAIKKTTKLNWKQWYTSKSEENKQIALQLQGLYERVAQKNMTDIYARIHDIERNQGAYLELKKNIWYVAKRQESKADLKKAVDAVKLARTQNAAARQAPAVIEPLVQRVSEVFSAHAHGSVAA
ncbi:MAG: hypothetical protein JSS60_04605 [Verrucomicrobia bacterium]|nr:hypothetical protein [Verrucomicrobiota bacterium]